MSREERIVIMYYKHTREFDFTEYKNKDMKLAGKYMNLKALY